MVRFGRWTASGKDACYAGKVDSKFMIRTIKASVSQFAERMLLVFAPDVGQGDGVTLITRAASSVLTSPMSTVPWIVRDRLRNIRSKEAEERGTGH